MTGRTQVSPSTERFYLLRVRLDGTTVKKILRDSFSRDEEMTEFIAVLLHYLYSRQGVDQMTEDLFKMWKQGKVLEEWPVLLQQEFRKLYPKKKHWAETKERLMKRKKDMTAEDIKAVERRQK